MPSPVSDVLVPGAGRASRAWPGGFRRTGRQRSEDWYDLNVADHVAVQVVEHREDPQGGAVAGSVGQGVDRRDAGPRGLDPQASLIDLADRIDPR